MIKKNVVANYKTLASNALSTGIKFIISTEISRDNSISMTGI